MGQILSLISLFMGERLLLVGQLQWICINGASLSIIDVKTLMARWIVLAKTRDLLGRSPYFSATPDCSANFSERSVFFARIGFKLIFLIFCSIIWIFFFKLWRAPALTYEKTCFYYNSAFSTYSFLILSNWVPMIAFFYSNISLTFSFNLWQMFSVASSKI